ncbi:cell division protein FtsA [Breznakiella homolactica]|uniref:Cell division protein FtsA n=1 Tax=Breznakiella homolactica TaxID=2798577 RepID=A0A7T7XRX2_9SPIR|nr:cell division protein FtsA [Breznakiella homolactica]QQO11371.1 cell division protein FtsA [Breznakiella homolactica]
MANDGLVVGLDIGTTKVCAVIGERNENGNLEITGVGVSPSTGLRKGVVVNIEATLRSVSAAIEAAEMMSGREVHSCWTGIGGSHIDSLNSRGVVAVTGRNRETREIGPEDIDRVLEAARAVVIPMDRQVLEVIPQSFIVDDQKGIRMPLDMIGVRLEAEVHIITCSVTSAQNLIKCVNRAGFRANGLILQCLASGRSVLTEEEKELGVALVDLGGGTTDMLVYSQGSPYSTTTVPAGGAQVTSDISILKNLSFETAERIKLDAGCCWEPLLEGDDEIIVPGVGGRPPLPIPKSHILKIIQPRMEEIFNMVRDKLDQLSLSRPLGGGVVLTGGGAQLLGAAELASHIFNMPVRVGVPLSVGGLVEEYRSPEYATAVGLMLEGASREEVKMPDRTGESRSREKGQAPLFGRLADWLKKEFF